MYEITKKSHCAVGKQQVPNLQIMTRWGVIIHQRYQKRGMTPVAEVQGIDDTPKSTKWQSIRFVHYIISYLDRESTKEFFLQYHTVSFGIKNSAVAKVLIVQ